MTSPGMTRTSFGSEITEREREIFLSSQLSSTLVVSRILSVFLECPRIRVTDPAKDISTS